MGRKGVFVLVSPLVCGMFGLCGGTGILAAQDTSLAVESKLTPADAAPGNFFGATVAVRGRTAVIGAHQMNIGAGAAYVFRYDGSGWTQTARLAPSDGATGDQFGRAIALGDKTIVIGAQNKTSGAGAAYVFELQGTSWVQTQKLSASDPQAGARFGAALAMDGGTLLVGAHGHDGGAGAAYAFEHINGAWQQTALLLPGDRAAGDRFSLFVAMAGDTALLGSVFDDDRGVDSGSAYVFTRSNGIWAQSQKLLASDGATSDLFGIAGSISGDTLVIGARADDDFGSSSGSAYVYQLQNGTWVQTAKLRAADGRGGDIFGHSVAISGDRIVVGAKWRDDNGRSSSGAAYVFERTDGLWSQLARLNASDAGFGDEYGQSVAIDGPIVLVGSHRHSGDRGAAYAYHPPNMVDADQSLLAADDSLISAYGGQTRIVVTPRKADGTDLGPGLEVVLSTVGGSLTGSVTDNGDGTYSQVLQGTPGASEAVVSATVEGLGLTPTAVVTMLPVSLSTSTVEVSPAEVASGQSATVTVTPKTGTGSSSGPGFDVTIETTLGTLVGLVNDNGDGTYSQLLDTGTEGTASITASVNGLSLEDTATLSVVPATPVGRIVGIHTDDTYTLFKSIQDAVDNATDSMTIMLAPGHFDEVVLIDEQKNLTIQALPRLGLTTVRGIRIEDSQHITIDGIHVDATGSKCEGIVVHNSGGIVLQNGLVQDTCSDRPGIRIKMGNGDVLVQNFGVTDCGRDGICVKGDNGHGGQLRILGCTVRDNQSNGICVDKHAAVTIEGCTIASNGLKGRDREGYGVLRQRQNGGKKQTKARKSVVLTGNKIQGNHGRVVRGTSDENLGNYDQMITR